jgi:hypothetical protein
MKKKDYTQLLKLNIESLEEKQANDLLLLKAQVLVSLESIKPANIIKDTLTDLTADPEFKGDILKTTLSIATGFIAKKMVVGETHNPIKQFFGTLLQMGVTNAVSKNSEGIKSTFQSIFKSFFSKRENPAE